MFITSFTATGKKAALQQHGLPGHRTLTVRQRRSYPSTTHKNLAFGRVRGPTGRSSKIRSSGSWGLRVGVDGVGGPEGPNLSHREKQPKWTQHPYVMNSTIKKRFRGSEGHFPWP